MAAAEHQIGVNTNLQKQDLNNLDISNLNALSPEVISRQATINIGTIGHVAHGKSTVVKAISGVQTVRFKNELERNITIKLERLKEEEIQKLLTIPNYIKTFEDRQRKKKEKMKCLTETRRNLMNINASVNSVVNSFQRGNSSSSSSSGYGSIDGGFNEDNKRMSSRPLTRLKANILSHSSTKRRHSQIERFSGRLLNKQNREDKENNDAKRRKSCSSIPLTTTNATNATPRRPYRKRFEYVVEDIVGIESINARPVFFVKWLNYSSKQNTWEPLGNLKDCLILEHFIENRYTIFQRTINEIMKELDLQIETENLRLDISKVSMKTVDQFDACALKAYLIILAQCRNAKSLNYKEQEKMKQQIIDLMFMQTIYEQRQRQLKAMEKFREKILKVEPKAPINIENFVDLDVPEPDFVYIKESFAGKNVPLLQVSPVGCTCVDGQCVPSRNCCARLAGSFFAYNSKGRLRILPGEAIYECNSVCSCDATCANRVIQRGRQNSLCLFKTSNGCGWGVRTDKLIHKGEFVCEYVGEIITCEEANERGKLYDAKGRTYLFDLDYNTTQESVYTVDAAMYGNISHFINHSCEPNLAVFPYWNNNLDVNMPGLAFFALRRIPAGEELTFDYIRSDLEEKTDDNIYENLSNAEKVSCRCGAAKCRKVLF